MADPHNENKQIFNPDAKETDLTVFKNIESAYSPLPPNYGKSNIKYDMGFVSDSIDEWNLYWMGQLWNHRDGTWQDKGVDPNYDPFAKDNLEGYEQYANKFTDVINKEHHDFLKENIDKNLDRRTRLEASERGILPALVAGVFDPVNWIPIPFAAGIGFGSRFLKGGLIASGLVGATEPIRRTLDRTSTNEETFAYIAGSFFLGGILSGTFGRRIAQETIRSKGGINGLAKTYFKAHHKTEGKPDFEVDGFDWKIGEDAYNAVVVNGNTNRFVGKKYQPVWMDVIKPSTVKVVTESDIINIDKQITDIQDKIVKGGFKIKPEAKTKLQNKIAELEQKKAELKPKIGAEVLTKYKMYLDEGHLRNLYEQAKIHPEVFGASPMKKDIFKSADDFITFMMKKEVYKKIGYFKKRVDETPVDAENRLNAMVYDDLLKTAKIDQSTDTNKYLEWVEAWSNYGAAAKLSRQLKDPWFVRRMHEISGDYGTATYGNKYDVATMPSAYMESSTKWFSLYRNTIHGIKDDFNEYRSGNANSDRVLDMNLSKGIIQTQDAMDYAITKMNGRNDNVNPVKMTWNEYSSKTFHAVVDEKVYGDSALPPMIRKSADRVRKMMKTMGDDAEELKMFTSQGAYKQLMEKRLGRIEELEALLGKTSDDIGIAINNFNKLEKFVARIRKTNPDKTIENQYFKKGKDFDLDRGTARYINKHYKELPEELDRFLMEQNVKDLETGEILTAGVEIRGGHIGQLRRLSEEQTFPEFVTDTKALNKWQIARYKKMLDKENNRYKEIKKELEDYNLDSISPPNETKNTYLTRMWRLEKIEQNPEKLKAILHKHFTAHPLRLRKNKKNALTGERQIEYISTDPDKVQARVDDAFETITEQARLMDAEGFAGFHRGRAGAKPLMTRKIDIPNREVMEFIETDVEYVLRQYYLRMGPSIELARNFGDKNLESFMHQAEMRLVRKHLKKEADNNMVDRMLNYFEDEKDKLLGHLNLEDPSTLSKRSASLLRDWASTAFMGKVIFSAQVDMARPIAVNGFKETFKHGRLPKFLRNMGAYKDAIAELKELSPAAEIVMGSARKRVMEDGGQIGLGRTSLGRIFDKYVAQPLHKIQGPFYIANLLAPWTVLWKDFQGILSAHRLIQDSIKVSKGTATQFELTRLASYGIDIKTAKLISRMPYELIDGNLYVSNSSKWQNYNGGLQAIHKFRQAIYGDVNRTIITPTPTDQFNLMHGVFRVNNDQIAKQFDEGLIGPDRHIWKLLGFQKTERGGKFSNSWGGLPFQFFSWAVAANRKLVISGLQGRELNAMAGIVAMISFGMMGDYFKNPRYWVQKSMEEKIIRGVELSGILGIFTDVNFMLETISGGMFDTPIGIRPMTGQNLRFGDPDVADALGEFSGAGPSIPLDLLYAFMTNQDYDEKSATMRRIIPLNTLWFWDRTFKNLWDWGEEKLRY
tara:strand:- start:96 stop:4427 length:4332 start_codon:yes stop_codon:yes gene_type:complete